MRTRAVRLALPPAGAFSRLDPSGQFRSVMLDRMPAKRFGECSRATPRLVSEALASHEGTGRLVVVR